MSTNTFRTAVLGGALMICGLAMGAPEDPSAPLATSPATKPAGRPQEQIIADFRAAQKALPADISKLMGDPGSEPAKAAAVQVRKVISILDEAVADPSQARGAAQARAQFRAMLIALGDADARKEFADAAKASPESVEVAQTVMTALRMVESPAIRDEVEAVGTEVLKGEIGKQVQEEIAGARKLRSLEGKPLVLAGPGPDGVAFSTEKWKGKVILVDFWATWCGPCMAELPRVKAAYKEYHDKGFEVLGVSCDRDAKALAAFMEKNKEEAPWQQLFDQTKPGWHALAKEYGISGIPTMLLIDKKGVVRTVSAREKFEELIPKMLAE